MNFFHSGKGKPTELLFDKAGFVCLNTGVFFHALGYLQIIDLYNSVHKSKSHKAECCVIDNAQFFIETIIFPTVTLVFLSCSLGRSILSHLTQQMTMCDEHCNVIFLPFCHQVSFQITRIPILAFFHHILCSTHCAACPTSFNSFFS